MMYSLISFMLIQVSPEKTLQNKDYWVSQLKNSNPQLRINALQKLSELKYVDTINSISLNLSDPEGDVRFAAIRALSLIPAHESLAALETALTAESDPYLKSEIRRGKKSLEDLLKQEDHGAKKETETPKSR